MKKKTIMKSVLSAILMTVTVGADAQTTWVYTYDAAGNRTQRSVNNGSKARQKTIDESINLIEDEKTKAIMDIEGMKLKIESLGCSNVNIAIYDLTGREMITRCTDSGTVVIDLRTLHRGTYILDVVIDNEKRTCKFNK